MKRPFRAFVFICHHLLPARPNWLIQSHVPPLLQDSYLWPNPTIRCFRGAFVLVNPIHHRFLKPPMLAGQPLGEKKETRKRVFLTGAGHLPLHLALLGLLIAAFVLFSSLVNAQSVDLTG